MAPQPVNQDAETENQLQNWDNFCQYHLDDWYGTWTSYSLEGRSNNAFKCVRSFHLREDGSQANLQRANLSGAELNEAKLSGAIMPDCSVHD